MEVCGEYQVHDATANFDATIRRRAAFIAWYMIDVRIISCARLDGCIERNEKKETEKTAQTTTTTRKKATSRAQCTNWSCAISETNERERNQDDTERKNNGLTNVKCLIVLYCQFVVCVIFFYLYFYFSYGCLSTNRCFSDWICVCIFFNFSFGRISFAWIKNLDALLSSLNYNEACAGAHFFCRLYFVKRLFLFCCLHEHVKINDDYGMFKQE